MLAKRIIPCLDVRGGRVVKGINFINLKDAGSPIEQAKIYSQEGADELVFLDITASVENRPALLEVVKATAEQVFIPFTVGGGIRNLEDIHTLLRAGADKVSINTAGLENPELIKMASKEFGAQCIVVAIDAKLVYSSEPKDAKKKNNLVTGNSELETKKWEVYAYGGRKPTGLDALEWAKKAEELGAGEILLTSMDKDGTKQGYDLKLTQVISENVNIPVIASGGAGSLEHLYQALSKGKASAALAASIFHYGEYSIKEAKEFLKNKGVPIRI